MKLTILLSIWIAAASSQPNCDNYRDKLSCHSLELKPDQPIDVNSSSIELSLRRASGSIGIKTFSLMTELRKLELRWCQITTIEDGALCSPPHLEEILISECGEFPVLTKSLFNNCDNLKKLYLFDLKLAPFTGEFLEPMRNLNELDLRRNELGEINSNTLCTPPKLETLSITGNSLSSSLTKSLFEKCNNVVKFLFYCNGIVNVEEEAFANFVNLKIAMFNSLNITHLTKTHLSGLNNLESLHIRNSSVSSISEDAFEDLVKLDELSMIFNNLQEFNSAMLSNCPDVRSLRLTANDITTIDNFKHPNIQYLDVSLNSIEQIDIDTVKLNLPRLKNLDVAWNKMSFQYKESLKNKFSGLNDLAPYNRGTLYQIYEC